MVDDRRDDVVRQYPHLFGQSGFPAVGDGWQNLLESALARITDAIAHEPAGSRIRIVQIKQKFASNLKPAEQRDLLARACLDLVELDLESQPLEPDTIVRGRRR